MANKMTPATSEPLLSSGSEEGSLTDYGDHVEKPRWVMKKPWLQRHRKAVIFHMLLVTFNILLTITAIGLSIAPHRQQESLLFSKKDNPDGSERDNC